MAYGSGRTERMRGGDDPGFRLTLAQVREFLPRYRWVIVGVFVATVLSAYAALNLTTEMYEARSALLVRFPVTKSSRTSGNATRFAPTGRIKRRPWQWPSPSWRSDAPISSGLSGERQPILSSTSCGMPLPGWRNQAPRSRNGPSASATWSKTANLWDCRMSSVVGRHHVSRTTHHVSHSLHQLELRQVLRIDQADRLFRPVDDDQVVDIAFVKNF